MQGLKHMIDDFRKRGVDKQKPSRDTPKNHRLAVPPSPKPGPKGLNKPMIHSQLSITKEDFG